MKIQKWDKEMFVAKNNSRKSFQKSPDRNKHAARMERRRVKGCFGRAQKDEWNFLVTGTTGGLK